MTKAIILLSGGLDSATVLQIARSENKQVTALSFEYGQRHKIELDCARILAKEFAETHITLKLDPQLFQGSALVGDEIAVPKYDIQSTKIPVTYVPARNILFLSHALSLAESIQADSIYLGVNALDYSGYPDCRPEFIQAYEIMARLGTKAGSEGNPIKLMTPLINWDKARIIQEGIKLNVDYAKTNSCYNPGLRGQPCLECDSCYLRAKGFKEAGIKDPLLAVF